MAAVNLTGSYNYALVALSVLIAMFASYAALDLAGRITAAGGWTRVFWLLGGAGAMGTGIWSMHYIGMLAFILPIPVAYHWPTVLLSLLAAVLASVIALYVVSRQKMGASRAVAGSVLMGAGIASMHYIGMAAMRSPAICQFNSSLVVMSVVFAVLISFAALWITFHFRDEKTGIGPEKLAGAVVMGAAIPVMHYTGMAAASFTPSGMPADLSHAVSISTLGTTGIAAVTFVVLGLALLTASVDRRFAAQTLELQEQKLQRSEAYLAEAQRLTHTGSWAWRAGGDALHLSEEWYRIYSFDPENGPPAFEQLLQRTHPEDRAKWKGAIDRAIDQKSDYEVEFRILLPDATTKYIHTVGHPVLNPSGDLVQFVGSSTDITERKRAEQATLLLAAIVESSHDAIVSKSLDGVITSWNKGAERLFGYSAEEAVGQNITLIIPPERRDEERTIIEQLTRGERIDHFETVRMRKDGSLLDVSLTISPMKDASGRVVGASKLARDITERKRAEEALRQAQTDLAHASRLTTLGEFTASLAHEVKQPIAAAVTDANTCVRWITRDEPDLKEAREAAWRIVKDANRAAEIINRVRLL
jgi:PAS domain S-box-containing protein